jgi:hypothetical protein
MKRKADFDKKCEDVLLSAITHGYEHPKFKSSSKVLTDRRDEFYWKKVSVYGSKWKKKIGY